MKIHGIGCYNNKSKSWLDLINSGINLKTCTLHELESIRGIGPKTARCFLIHSRPNQNYAGLDTHLLKFLRMLGYNAPKSTPNKKSYLSLENEFLKLVSTSSRTVAEVDLMVWNYYSLNSLAAKKEIKLFLTSIEMNELAQRI
jgi:thermostable 8-oxoguanine DNA glycosylase